MWREGDVAVIRSRAAAIALCLWLALRREKYFLIKKLPSLLMGILQPFCSTSGLIMEKGETVVERGFEYSYGMF